MAKYTTELRSICEVYAGYDEQQGLGKVDEVISKALPKLFDFDFPIYDEAYRTVLETKIVKHFYTREICAETVGRWKLFLNERMNLIMPYYNQRYKSTLIQFNPLYDTDITSDHNKKNNGDSSNNSNATSSVKRNDWEYYSDTPQGGVEGLEGNNYLTNATHNTADDNSNGNTKTDNTYKDTEDYLEHIVGKRGGDSYSKLLDEYRKTFLNIDEEIIERLNDLFFNLW